MKMKNTITFEGTRDFLSSTGNVERFSFRIVSSNKSLHEESVEQIVDMHGFGGQSFSVNLKYRDGDSYIYEGTTTRYSD
jgi:hypothetical protein